MTTAAAADASRAAGDGAVSRRRRGRIGVVLFTTPTEIGPFCSKLLFGVVGEARRHDLEVSVWFIGGDEPVTPRAPAGELTGMIVMGKVAGDPWLEQVAASGVPTVVVGRWAGIPGRVQSVDSDHVGGTEQLVTHLASLGRRRIAVITGMLDVFDVILRLHTFERMRVELGLDRGDDLVVAGDFTARSGDLAMRELLRRRRGDDDRIDAVFAMNDAMAAGAIHALLDAGLRVPDDVAVAGFDAAFEPNLLPMEVTSARQNVAELGRRAVLALVDLVAGAEPGDTEVVGVDLVFGQSTVGRAHGAVVPDALGVSPSVS
ncbi:MAG: substrate-binding domain-containing protein [Acidimicrobiales bacterium]